MERKKEPIILPALLFSVYLLLFPIDSALGELIGTISINNYIAIASLALTVVFAIKRIMFKFDNFTIIYLVYVIYQFLIMTNGGYFFTNRNIIFLFYNFMTIIFIHVKWTERELKLFRYMIVISIIIACAIIITNVQFNSSGRLYLALGRNIDQNYLSANMIFGTALISNSLFKSKYKHTKFFSFVLLVWIMLCIFYLGSRGSLIGNLVIVATIYLLNRENRDIKKDIIMFFIAAIAVVIAYFLLPEWIIERFSIANMIESGGSGRIQVWSDYLYIYLNGTLSSTLFGFGRGYIYDTSSMVNGKCTHNIFLKSLVEGGIIGLILNLIFIYQLFTTARKAQTKEMIAVVLGYLVCGIFLDLDDYRIFPLMIIIIMMYKDHDYYFDYFVRPGKRKIKTSN